jgi:hypothetical protein
MATCQCPWAWVSWFKHRLPRKGPQSQLPRVPLAAQQPVPSLPTMTVTVSPSCFHLSPGCKDSVGVDWVWCIFPAKSHLPSPAGGSGWGVVGSSGSASLVCSPPPILIWKFSLTFFCVLCVAHGLMLAKQAFYCLGHTPVHNSPLVTSTASGFRSLCLS